MLLTSLSLTNFRVFDGTHNIDLEPRMVNGQKRPIVLFGGLNGSGKTSILTAIRLVLYGSRCLGRSVSKRTYYDYLTDCVHISTSMEKKNDHAEIGLTFKHGEQGGISSYLVTRKWSVAEKSVKEKLSIEKDGKELFGMTYDQCQSFLNELIPVGISDLFFFDGEKIADLAEEEGSSVLREAINRLMGIDIINRLRNDLAIFLKTENTKEMTSDLKKQLLLLEDDYQVKFHKYETAKENWQSMEDRLQLLKSEISVTERQLNDRGGEWAKRRETEEFRLKDLERKKADCNVNIISLLDGLAPLSLAPKALSSLVRTLEKEQHSKHRAITQSAIAREIEVLKARLNKVVPEVIKENVSKIVEQTYEIAKGQIDKAQTVLHDISDSQFFEIKYAIKNIIPEKEKELKNVISSLETLDIQIDGSEKNLARSPEAATLKDEFERLKEQTTQRLGLEFDIKRQKETVKAMLNEALRILRLLRALDSKISESKKGTLATEYASNARVLLKVFANKTTEYKIARLEAEFARAFKSLARKDDIDLTVKIDPNTLHISLTDSRGRVIKRQQMSAGERQIYAIAMLEALGRTTGHSLPIIIDTPLGRLDSQHRFKLVHNYFPVASHQVIILSTDSEVDENFFNGLEREISHGYEINYDQKTNSSFLSSGYFWKQKIQEAV